MNRARRALLVALPAIIVLCTAVALAPPAAATTVYVDDSYGSDDPAAHQWMTVQSGIYDAAPGDTVFVYDGYYVENVTMWNASVILEGQSRAGVVIDRQSGAPVAVIDVRAAFVIIRNLTLTHGDYGVRTTTTAHNNGTLDNLTIYEINYDCIEINAASSWTIHDTSLSSCGYGAIAFPSGTANSQHYVFNIAMTTLTNYDGIYLYAVSYSRFENFTVQDPGRNGIYTYNSYENTFNGFSINSSASYGVYMYNADNTRFLNGSITNKTGGVQVFYAYISDYGMLDNITIASNAGGGIYLQASSYWRWRSVNNTNVAEPIDIYYTSPIVLSYFQHDIDTSNTILGLPVVYFSNASGSTYNGAAGWFAAVNSTALNVTLNTTISTLLYGVMVFGTNGSTFTDFNSSGNAWNFVIERSHNNTFANTRMASVRASGGTGGIYVHSSTYNLFSGGLWETPARSYTAMRFQASSNANNNTVANVTCDTWYYCFDIGTDTADLVIDNVTVADTIYGVYSYYATSFTIQRSLFLYNFYYSVYISGNSGQTIDRVVIRNNTINHTTYYYALFLGYMQTGTIENNTINDSDYAVYAYYSRNLIIRNNLLNYSRTCGIRGDYSDYLQVINNTVPYGPCALQWYYSSYWTLRSNVVANMTSAFQHSVGANYPTSWFIHDMDATNLLNGYPVLYVINATSGTFSGAYSWIAVVNSSNVTVSSTINVSRNQGGLFSFEMNDSVVETTNFSGNLWGMLIYESDRNTIRDVNVSSNTAGGIYVWQSDWNLFLRDRLRPDTLRADYGIQFEDTSNNNTMEQIDCVQFSSCVRIEYIANFMSLLNSTLNDSYYAVYTSGQFGPRVEGNVFNYSYYQPIVLQYSPSRPTTQFRIANNTFNGTNYQGVYCYACLGGSIEDNSFRSSQVAIYLYQSDGVLMARNSVRQQSSYGFQSEYSDFNVAVDNFFDLGGSSNAAFYFSYSRFWVLRGNNVTNNSLPVSWSFPVPMANFEYAMHDADATNMANGYPWRWWVNATGVSFNGTAGLVYLTNSTAMNVTVSNPVSWTASGIGLVGTTGSTFYNTNLSRNYWGVVMYHSHNNTFLDLTVWRNTAGGAYISYSDWNRFLGGVYTPDASYADSAVHILAGSRNNTISINETNFSSGVIIDYNAYDNRVDGGSYNFNYYGVQSNSYIGTRVENASFADNYYYHVYQYGGGSGTYFNRISNNTMHRAPNYDGIYVYNVGGGVIADNLINMTGSDGVYLQSTSGITVARNLFTNGSGYAINGYSSASNFIVDNVVTQSRYGLYLYDSRYWTFVNNSFSNFTSTTPWAVYFNAPDPVTDATVFMHYWTPDNTIEGLPVRYYVNQTGVTFSGLAGWIVAVNCTFMDLGSSSLNTRNYYGALFVKVFNSTLRGYASNASYYGAALMWGADNRIENISVNASYRGIYLSNNTRATINGVYVSNATNAGLYPYISTRLNITNSTFYRNQYGVYLEYRSQYVNITNNTFDSHTYIAIYTEATDDVRIVRNTVQGSLYWGIFVQASSGDHADRDFIIENRVNATGYYDAIRLDYMYGGLVEANNVTGTGQAAIYLYQSNGNLVRRNTFRFQGYGFYVYGDSNSLVANAIFNSSTTIYIQSGGDFNKFYHNNLFTNNTSFYDAGTSNTFDNGYPAGGNYWSNTTHTDIYTGAAQTTSGSDGINDTAANLPYGRRDNYPLSQPWPPYAFLVGPANGSVIQAGVTVDFNVSFYFNSVQYALNNGTTSNFTSPFDISTSGMPDGDLYVQLWANDTWYNISAWYLFGIDSTSPAIALDGPPAGGTYPVGTQLNFTVSDAHLAGNATWSSGSGNQSFAAPWDISTGGWAEGDYNVTIRAWDTAGNAQTSTFLFKLDSTPPAITLVSPANNSFIAVGTLINLSVTDAHLNAVTWDNGSGANLLVSPFDISTVGWGSATWSITVIANDTGGLTTTRVFVFTIDASPPLIVLNSPANNTVFEPGQLLDFDVTDTNLGTVTWNTGSGPTVLAAPFDLSTTGWADGPYNVTITADDSAGNVAVAVFHFEVDSAAPTITAVSPASGAYIPAGTIVDFSVSDPHLASATWSIGSGDNPLTSPFDISTGGWADGGYTVVVNATDSLGHAASRSLSFTIDSTPPTVTLNTPANGSFFPAGVTIDLSVSDANLNAVDWTTSGAPTSLASPYDIGTGAWADGAYTLRVNATDLAGNLRFASFTFTVDSTPPAVTLIAPANNSHFPAGTTIDLSVADANLNTVDWTISGAPSTLAAPFDILTGGWADGAYLVRINATDLAGNLRFSSYTFTVDSTFPAITLNAPANNSFFAPGTTIDLSVADTNLNAVDWTTGGAPTALASPFDISTTGWTDSVYTVRVNATDLAGNLRFASFTFTVDSGPPVITLNSPSNLSHILAGTTIDLTVADGNLNTVDWTTGGAPTPLASPWDISTAGWTDGVYTVRVNATDLAGNLRFSSFTFTVDSTPPAITLNSPSNLSYFAAGATIDLSVSDTNLNIVNWTTGGAPTLLGSPHDISTTGWADGVYTVRVNATDLAGNLRFSSFTFTVDSGPPVITLNSPSNLSYILAGTTIDLTVTDGNLNTVNWTTAGAPTSLASPWDISTAGWTDGLYTVRVNATDLAGNLRFSSFTFTIDSTPPAITLNSPSNLSYFAAGAAIDLSVSDTNLNTVNWTTGGAPTTLASPYDISTTGWADGVYTVRVNATDLAGNRRFSSFTFTVDSTPPTVAMSSPANNSYVMAGTTLDLSVSDTNLNTVNWTTSGTPAAFAAPYDISTTGWADGVYTLRVNATDLAGNLRFSSFTVTIDSTTPTVTLVSPATGSFVRAGTTLDFAVADTNLNTVVWNNGGADASLASPYDIATGSWADGAYTVRVTATDLAGNSQQRSMTVTIDSTAPTLVLNSPAPGAVVRAGTTLDFSAADTNLNAVTYSNGSGPITLAAPYDVDTAGWQDGSTAQWGRAVDLAGNEAWVNFTLVFDSSPASITLLAPANGSVVRAGTLLRFSVTDANFLNASYVNGTADVGFSSPFIINTTGYFDRNYNFTIFVTDLAGNLAFARFNFTIDSTLPQVQLLSPANNTWLPANTLIDFAVSDTNLAAVNVTLDGAPLTLLAGYDYNTNNLTDGPHTFVIVAVDGAGNQRSLTAFWRVDKTAPTIASSIAGGSYVRAAVLWSFTINEANLQLAAWKNSSDSTFGPFATNFTIDKADWPDGPVDVTVSATDFAGNMVQQVYTFTLDTTPPALDSPNLLTTTKYVRSGVPLEFRVTAEASPYVQVLWLKGTAEPLVDLGGGSFTFTFTTQPEDGSDYDLLFEVTDLAGNAAQLLRVVKIDNTPPQFPATFPMAYGGPEDSPFDFHGSATDLTALPDELAYEWRFDPSTPMPLDILSGRDATFTFNTPGQYAIEVGVSDPAGNTNNTTFVITIFDITPPSLLLPVTFLSVDEDTEVNITQSSGDNALGNLTWTWRAAAANLTSTGPNITWIFTTPGVYNITVTVTDPSNNSAQGFVIVDVQDVTLPDVTIDGPTVTDVLVRVNFTANVTDNDPRYSILNWTYFWTFTHGSDVTSKTGRVVNYIDIDSGTVRIDLNVTDASGNRRHVTRSLLVNKPPEVGTQPPTEVGATEPWVWTPNATDPEESPVTITVISGPPGMTTAGGSVVWTPGAGDVGSEVNVTVAISDGITTVYRDFTIYVVDPAKLAGNHKPVFDSEPPTDASVSKTYLYDIAVYDADGDEITILISGLEGYDYDPAARRLSWLPPWQPNPNEVFERLVPVTITAFDGIQSSTQEFTIRFRNPPNQWPELLGGATWTLGDVHVGETRRIEVPRYWFDKDDVYGNLSFVINSTDADLRRQVSGILEWYVEKIDEDTVEIVFTVKGVGKVDFPFVARDPSRATSEDNFVSVNALPIAASTGPLPWWLWIAILGGGAAGAAGLAVSLRRSRSASRVAQNALEVASKAPTERVIIQQAPAAAAVERRKDTYVIEGVFVIYSDGRMIFSKTDASADVKLEDPELVASMFSAVQSFIKDSFQATGELNRLGFGENTILIERGAAIFMAAIIYGEPQDDLFEAMKGTVRTIENAYTGIIEEWDGSTTSLEAIDQYVLPFLALTATRTRADVKAAMTEKIVKMLSELEFFQGFVRLKCGVKNDTENVITKVTVSIDFNEDVLRLHHIEPTTYKIQGSETQLGVLNPGEKVSVAYYFDPQICTESQIDGVARYRDAKGAVHSLSMKTRKAEVVCPIFFTKEHANTAMLKRLVEGELDQRDSKVYNIKVMPEKMTHEELFGLAKEVVLSHDVHLVRDFIKEAPYHGEAWFYGETKVKGYKIVIRASVMEDGQRIEFFAASTQIRAITGLLAEFNHTLNQLIGRKFATLKLESEFGEDVKQDIQKKSLMSTMSSAELEGGETDQDG